MTLEFFVMGFSWGFIIGGGLALKYLNELRDRYWEGKAMDGTRAATKRGLYHVTLDRKFAAGSSKGTGSE